MSGHREARGADHGDPEDLEGLRRSRRAAAPRNDILKTSLSGWAYFFFLPLAAGLVAFFAFFGFAAFLAGLRVVLGGADLIRGSLVTVGIV